jgi:hypothetical protein
MSSLTTTDRSRHQDIHINVLQTIAGRADACCWHFNGDNDAGYNKSSLSHLLGIDHDDMVLIMEKCGYMDGEKTVDRFQLERLVDRIGKESCELMHYRLRSTIVENYSASFGLVLPMVYMQWQLQGFFSRKDFLSSFPHEVTVLGCNRNLMESNFC